MSKEWMIALAAGAASGLVFIAPTSGTVIGLIVVSLFVGSRRTPYDWVAGTVVIGRSSAYTSKENIAFS